MSAHWSIIGAFPCYLDSIFENGVGTQYEHAVVGRLCARRASCILIEVLCTVFMTLKP